MGENKILFADGTVLENCSVGFADGNLWIYTALSVREAAEIFLDAARTAEIAYTQGDYTQTYVGYTDPRNIDAIPEGTRVMMRKEPTTT